MSIQKLAGYLCMVIFALCLSNHLCSARKGEIRRRFMNNFGVPVCHHCVHGQCMPNDFCFCQPGWTGQGCDKLFGASSHEHSHCGHHHCVHGSCSYSMMNGIERYHICNCHPGWKGDACDIAVDHVDHCKNNCMHGTCVSNSNTYGHHCECDRGWEGGHCEVQSVHQSPGTANLDNCNNLCDHGTCDGSADQHYCNCEHGWYGIHCDYPVLFPILSSTSTPVKPMTTTTTTTETTTTTTTTPRPTTMTTTLPPASATSSTTFTTSIKPLTTFPTCDHLAVLMDITQQTQVVNQKGAECSPGSHTSHDALVLEHCTVPQNPSSWQQGVHVMSYCGGSGTLPNYTPIAAFDNGVYSSKGSLSGVFIGCTNTGFKIAYQTCGHPPHIEELVLGGANTQNPNTYYTLQ